MSIFNFQIKTILKIFFSQNVGTIRQRDYKKFWDNKTTRLQDNE